MQKNHPSAATGDSLSLPLETHPQREEPRSDRARDLEQQLLDPLTPIRAICWSGQNLVRVIRDN
jgi:hypothetical protein